ncbi:MAG TPA: PIN domain-containing protein [Bacillota bacterium]|jgi:predicted nucleic acid-binding protein|nr:PIN domain-containing protein [Bacillota bacterium]
MSIRCFVDTSAWFALLMAADQYHAAVRAEYALAHSEGGIFITSSLVLGELHTLLLARTGTAAGFWSFRDDIALSGQVRVLHPTTNQLDMAFDLLRRRPDKSYSFVDATSFVMMRDESIHTALSLDRHFAQEGFAVIPVPEECLHEPPQAYPAAPTSAGEGS